MMILHILKMIKARLGGNGWILAELLVVMVVMCVMTDYFLSQWRLFSEPVGFKVDRVYQATLAMCPTNSPSFITYEEGSDEPARNIGRIAERLGQHPDVEAVALSFYSLPYTRANMGGGVAMDSVFRHIRKLVVTPSYFDVFGIRPAAGGGTPEELGERLKGLREESEQIISAGLARMLYGHTDAVGGEMYFWEDSVPRRVVAVTEPLRNDEYDRRLENCVFSRLEISPADGKDRMKEDGLRQLQVTFRLRPGVTPTADYGDRFLREERQSLRAGNFWVSEVRSYAGIRSSFLDNGMETNSRKMVSALGAFLLVNVFLAVIGTFWIHVRRRRSELGLRMVAGSTRRGVQGLMIGEGLALLAIASVPALLICANLAVADFLPCAATERPVLSFCLTFGLTWTVLGVVVALATWYPARRASRLEPADALRYE